LATLDDVKEAAATQPEVFRGVNPETPETLAIAEEQLGVTLPSTLKWLLIVHEYSDVCGIDSLDQTVADTLRCRQSMNLPLWYVVLNDWNDAGVVFLDLSSLNSDGECAVRWAGALNLHRLAIGEDMDDDVDNFESYADWVMSRLRDLPE
jgi:hypothetical protein